MISTLFQPIILCKFLLYGFVAGMLFSCLILVVSILRNKLLFVIIFDVIGTIAGFILFFICNLRYNFGQFRFFAVLVFICGILLEIFSIGFFIAKLSKLFYNKNIIEKRRSKNDKGKIKNGSHINNNTSNFIAG